MLVLYFLLQVLLPATSFSLEQQQLHQPLGTDLSQYPTLPSLSILLHVSYDGSRFTGWSAANDPPPNSTSTSSRVRVIGKDFCEAATSKSQRKKRHRSPRRRDRGGGGFVRSVQGTLVDCLQKLYGNVARNVIAVNGCSRTDKGVHATAMMAHVVVYKSSQQNHNENGRLDAPNRNKALPMELPKLQTTLNRMLPDDIRIINVGRVLDRDFHPTRSARSKTYAYRLSMGGGGAHRDPTQWRQVWQIRTITGPSVDESLDIHAMQQASQLFLGRHDFQAFQGAPRGSDRRRQQQRPTSTLCHIFHCTVHPEYVSPLCHNVVIRIQGDRFVYKMVRHMVGALVEVGRHTLTARDIETALLETTGATTRRVQQQHRWTCAPAHGLSLVQVEYDDLVVDWAHP